MRTRRSGWAACLAILAIAGFALAGKSVPSGTVEGKNGWTVTESFRSTDVSDELTEWSDVTDLQFSVSRQALVENSSGGVYVVPRGWRSSPEEFCTGVVYFDPATLSFTGVVQVTGDNVPSSEGEMIFAAAIAPGTGGGLTKDDLLVLRWYAEAKSWNGSEWVGDEWVEVVRYPADATEDGGVDAAAEELLGSWKADRAYGALAADGDGNVYVIAAGMEQSGASLNDTIRKLSYDAGSGAWNESELLSGAGSLWHDLLAWDGTSLYAVVAGATPSDDNTVIEIAPSTGSSWSHSTFPALLNRASQHATALAADGSGTLRIGLSPAGSPGYVTEAPQSGAVSDSDRIAEMYLRCDMGGRAAGGLWIASGVYSVTRQGGNSYFYDWSYDAVFALTPASDGGSGGGGGGNGNGKGKNK